LGHRAVFPFRSMSFPFLSLILLYNFKLIISWKQAHISCGIIVGDKALFYALACSCAEDCGLTLSCCYESMDRHNLVVTEQLTCTQPVFPPQSFQVPGHVWMINSCPVRETINTLQTLKPNCSINRLKFE